MLHRRTCRAIWACGHILPYATGANAEPLVKQEPGSIVYQEVPQPSAAQSGASGSALAYGYVSGDVLPSSGHLCAPAYPSNVIVEYVRSYLPKDESAQLKNGTIDYA